MKNKWVIIPYSLLHVPESSSFLHFAIVFHKIIHLIPIFSFTGENGEFRSYRRLPCETAYLLNTTGKNAVLLFQELKGDDSKSVSKQ